MYRKFYEESEYNLILTKKTARRALSIIACTGVISNLLSHSFYALVSALLPQLGRLIGKLLMLSGSGKVYAMAFAESFIISEQLKWFFSIIAALICFFLPFAVIAKVLVPGDKESIISAKGPVMKSFPFVYCASIMMASAASRFTGKILLFLFPDFYNSIVSVSDTVGMYGSSTNPASLILAFVSMCVLAPVAEEFVYRGIAFGYLRQFGFTFAAISSSLLFGLAHSNPEQMSYAFVFGLMLCTVTSKTGNLKTSIIMHFINNLIGYIASYIFPLTDFGASEALFNIVYSLFVGVFAIIGMIILFKKAKKDTDTEEKTGVPVSCFFCAGTVLIIINAIMDVLSGIR